MTKQDLFLFVGAMVLLLAVFFFVIFVSPYENNIFPNSNSLMADTAKKKPDTLVIINISDSIVENNYKYEYYQQGIASWYGDPNKKKDPYHGKRTASGVIFNTHKMWAAHKTLPFGTKVRVSSTTDTVIVQIVDRGPFVKGRIIDLSWAAAQKLGIKGLGKVTIEKIYLNNKLLIEEIE